MSKKCDSQKEENNAVDKTINRADIILLLIILAAAIVAIAALKLLRKPGYKVELRIEGEVIKELPLDEDTSYLCETDKGTNRVVIKNGEAYVTDADCPDKICEDYKPISNVGEAIICLPHKLVVEVVD